MTSVKVLQILQAIECDDQRCVISTCDENRTINIRFMSDWVGEVLNNGINDLQSRVRISARLGNDIGTV